MLPSLRSRRLIFLQKEDMQGRNGRWSSRGILKDDATRHFSHLILLLLFVIRVLFTLWFCLNTQVFSMSPPAESTKPLPQCHTFFCLALLVFLTFREIRTHILKGCGCCMTEVVPHPSPPLQPFCSFSCLWQSPIAAAKFFKRCLKKRNSLSKKRLVKIT